MCPLTRRCAISRSVKNASSRGARVLIVRSGRQFRPGAGRRVRAVRARGQVPVGGARGDVTQVGGQQRQLGLHVDAVAIPVDQRLHRKGMPEIMKARRTSIVARRESGLPDQAREHAAHVVAEQTCSDTGSEEARRFRFGSSRIPPGSVGGQGFGWLWGAAGSVGIYRTWT